MSKKVRLRKSWVERREENPGGGVGHVQSPKGGSWHTEVKQSVQNGCKLNYMEKSKDRKGKARRDVEERQIMKCFPNHPKELELSSPKQWGAWKSNLIKSSEIWKQIPRGKMGIKTALSQGLNLGAGPHLGKRGRKGTSNGA